jgi:hypothetical protein
MLAHFQTLESCSSNLPSTIAAILKEDFQLLISSASATRQMLETHAKFLYAYELKMRQQINRVLDLLQSSVLVDTVMSRMDLYLSESRRISDGRAETIIKRLTRIEMN